MIVPGKGKKKVVSSLPPLFTINRTQKTKSRNLPSLSALLTGSFRDVLRYCGPPFWSVFLD